MDIPDISDNKETSGNRAEIRIPSDKSHGGRFDGVRLSFYDGIVSGIERSGIFEEPVDGLRDPETSLRSTGSESLLKHRVG